MKNPATLAAQYREMREARGSDDRSRWLLLIKELRATHQCSIYEAERLALLQPAWRRWVERQINSDRECAKMARNHIRYNGDHALIAEDDGKLIVRLEPGTETGIDAGAMLGDAETLRFYEGNARSYVGARPEELSADLLAFLPRLKSGASILELGCGSGLDAAEMERLGFEVVPTDGSACMAAIASERLGRKVDVLRFEDLDDKERYDAVVACASLLHVPVEGLPEVLRRIWASLKPGGWHFASFKTDGRPERDAHGRYYNYLDREAAAAIYGLAGHWQTMVFETYDGVGHFSAPARWLTVTARKSG